MTRLAFVTNLCPHYRRPLFELLASRLEVDFYFYSSGTEWYLGDAYRHVSGRFREMDLPRRTIRGQPIMPGVARVLTRSRYDAVVQSYTGRLQIALTVLTATARRLPLVIWTGIWDDLTRPFDSLTRPLANAAYRRADAIVAYGDHVKRYLAAGPRVDPGNVFVAGQAVDGSRFESIPRDGPGDDVLFVGRFEPSKGLDDLLAAFRALPEKARPTLRLAGSGSLEDELCGYATHERWLDVVGHVSQDELAGYLARARCLVLPSVTTARWREPWGLVVNEAMHASLPVIASDAVGAAAGGLVEDRSNGFVVPEGDVDGLRDAIQALMADPGRAEAMGRQARADVQRFSFERMADAFEAAIDHAMVTRRNA
jgi:glycosyltransferase involved in cell wall biosynthesis